MNAFQYSVVGNKSNSNGRDLIRIEYSFGILSYIKQKFPHKVTQVLSQQHNILTAAEFAENWSCFPHRF